MAFREIRHAARSLVRVPSLTAISILTVALGVGAGTALFSAVKAVLLNPLPYAAPGRLAWLTEVNDHGKPMQVSFQNFLDWRSANRSFAAMGAYEAGPAIVSGSDVPQSTFGAAVTEDFFRVMGADAIIGRTFSHDEQVTGGPLTVVIGYGLWQRAFGGSRATLGRSIHVFGMAPVVVGIMPQGFSYPEKAELWMPETAFGDPGFGVRTAHNWRVVGASSREFEWCRRSPISAPSSGASNSSTLHPSKGAMRRSFRLHPTLPGKSAGPCSCCSGRLGSCS